MTNIISNASAGTLLAGLALSITAAPVMAADGPAAAPSSITMYGIVDIGFVRETGGVNGTVNKFSSGVGSTSRIGFKGSEDLGDGLSALFVLESGLKLDTGESDVAGAIFNRAAYVGLNSERLGTVTVGRQYTPIYTIMYTVADPFGTGFAGNMKNLFPSSGIIGRASNMVLYSSPVLRGFTAQLAYSPGEQAGDNTAGRQIGLALGYTAGPLNLRFGYGNRNYDIAPLPGVAAISHDLGTNSLFAGNYDFGFIKTYVSYQIDKGYNSGVLPNSTNPYGGVAPTPSTDARDVLVGFTMPAGHGKFMVSYVQKDDRTAFDQDARQMGVGYQYFLSLRSSLYVSYAKIFNRNGAGYTVGNNSEGGGGDTGFNVGLRHSF